MYLQQTRSNWSPFMFPPLAKNDTKFNAYSTYFIIHIEAVYKEAKGRLPVFKDLVLEERKSENKIKRQPLKEITHNMEYSPSHFSLMALLKRCSQVLIKAKKNYPRSIKEVRRKGVDENKGKLNRSIVLHNWKCY